MIKARNPEAELQGPVWTKLPIVSLIIRSNNIFNIKVNGALVIHIIMHNSLTQNWNRLQIFTKFLCGYLLIDYIENDAN